MTFIPRVLVLLVVALSLQTVAGIRRGRGWIVDNNGNSENNKPTEVGSWRPDWIGKVASSPPGAIADLATSINAESCTQAFYNVVEDLKQIKSLITEYLSATVNVSRESLKCITSNEESPYRCLSKVFENHFHYYKLLNESMGEALKLLGQTVQELAACSFK